MSLIPVYPIFIPIITAMFIYVLSNKFVDYLAFVCQSILTILALAYYDYLNVLSHDHVVLIGGWNKVIGIALKNDKLSLAFIFLSLFIWWVILIYCWNKRKNDFKFLFFLLFLEGSFLGLLQTNDIFNLFIFIEIISIISTILITYKKDGYSIRAGLYYLLFNSVGMMFYLIGLILIYYLTGTLNMDVISERLAAIRYSAPIVISYIFIIAAIGVKSALFPVYNWLPKAHGAAPASISALLSGLLVKSGLYAFIRLNQMFQLDILKDFFFILGFATALSGVLFALSQKDIKQILAFHTISQIGIMLMGLSFLEGKIFVGGIMHIFNHAIFKSLLFLGAGALINQYETRKITDIRGVFKTFPFLSILMIIGMLSITGSPFFNGFISKTIIKYGFTESNSKMLMFYTINLGTSISFIKMSQIFFGSSNIQKKPDINSHISMGLLAFMCIILGNLYHPIVNLIFDIDFSYINFISIENWVIYIITLGLGYMIYKFIISKDYPVIKKLRHLSISFETTNMMLITFIFIMILWCNLF